MRPWARRKVLRASPERRTGSAPPRLADQPGRRPRRRSRPEVEALDLRVLMASGNPGIAQPAASAQLSERVAAAVKPYLDRHEFPGISVAIVTDGQVALCKDTGSETWRRRCLLEPTPVSTSVR